MGHPTAVRLRGSTIRGSCCPWSECHPTRPPTSAPLLHRNDGAGLDHHAGRWPTGPVWPQGAGSTVPVRLVDDDLANSLANGGRLDITPVGGRFAPTRRRPDGAVGRALCLAIDPDLLITVNAMTAATSCPARRGHQLPGTPARRHRPGRRIQLAGSIGTLVHRTCVTAAAFCRRPGCLRRVVIEG